MKTKHIIITLCCIISAHSCSKQEIPVFESDISGIYFQLLDGPPLLDGSKFYKDSIYVTYTLSPLSVTNTIVYAELHTMGKVRDHDRPVNISVDRDRTTAVQGVHFEVDLDTVRIPAGSSVTPVYVRLLRTPDMLENTYSIVLKIEDNDHFTCYLERYKGSSSYTLSAGQKSGTSFIISFSEEYFEPFYWLFAWYYFGDWSPQKYVLVNDLCNLTLLDWNNGGGTGSPVQLGRFGYFARILRDYLQEKADAGTPVQDRDGSYMQLGPDYRVDYSAYE